MTRIEAQGLSHEAFRGTRVHMRRRTRTIPLKWLTAEHESVTSVREDLGETSSHLWIRDESFAVERNSYVARVRWHVRQSPGVASRLVVQTRTEIPSASCLVLQRPLFRSRDSTCKR
jgi:hypothetical protein